LKTRSISCREATALASRALDGVLPRGGRLLRELRAHLSECALCARFRAHLLFLRAALARAAAAADAAPAAPGLPPAARARILLALRPRS
jgi:hypothetical protein